MLTLGDIAYNTGTSAELTSRFFDVYQSLLRHAALYPAVGNHEASDGSSDSATQTGPYYEAFDLPKAAEAGGLASNTEAYYSFDHGLTHFVVLDSDDSSTDPRYAAPLPFLPDDPRTRYDVAAFNTSVRELDRQYGLILDALDRLLRSQCCCNSS